MVIGTASQSSHDYAGNETELSFGMVIFPRTLTMSFWLFADNII